MAHLSAFMQADSLRKPPTAAPGVGAGNAQGEASSDRQVRSGSDEGSEDWVEGDGPSSDDDDGGEQDWHEGEEGEGEEDEVPEAESSGAPAPGAGAGAGAGGVVGALAARCVTMRLRE
jgi:hypothetical protein